MGAKERYPILSFSPLENRMKQSRVDFLAQSPQKCFGVNLLFFSPNVDRDVESVAFSEADRMLSCCLCGGLCRLVATLLIGNKMTSCSALLVARW